MFEKVWDKFKTIEYGSGYTDNKTVKMFENTTNKTEIQKEYLINARNEGKEKYKYI